jgi:hypothetical protein
MPYILEVLRFDPNGHIEHPDWYGKAEHIGYMNKIFSTKRDACDYYQQHNQHMRQITKDSNWSSDWDPNTFLMYVIRKSGYEYKKIQPFE